MSQTGILKNKLDDGDTLSQMSKQVKKLEKRPVTGFNWRSKQDRMMLYQMQKAFETFENCTQKIYVTGAVSMRKVQKEVSVSLFINLALYLKQIRDKTDQILNITEQDRLEKLINYEDRWPFLMFRKQLQKIRIYINMFAFKIIKHKVFETICIGIILLNSISLGLEDPLAVSTTPFQDLTEMVFLGLYSTEMCLKILGLGFFFNKGAYLRDPWNILDFVIVMSAYLTVIQDGVSRAQNGGKTPIVTAESNQDTGLSLNSLRAFRVLRPLRAITSIKGLQILVLSVLSSLPLLQDTIIVLLSFFVVMAIAGVQLMTGLLKNRCVNIETGVLYDDGSGDPYLCGGAQPCPSEEYFCGKMNENPNYGVTNFDNLMYGVLVVFQCVTMEGWSDVMIQYQMSWTEYSFFFFLPIIFIGAFFLVNLLLAVINSSFSQTHNAQQKKIALLKEKEKLKKRRPAAGDEIELDDSEPIEEMGITQYWIAKRCAVRIVTQYRKLQAKKLAAAIELANKLPEEEEEVKAMVITLPEPFNPDNIKVMHDEKPDSESDHEFNAQIAKIFEETPLGDKLDQTADKRKQTQDIKYFAVNDMRTVTKKEKGLGSKEVKKIQTNLKDKLAIKQNPETKMDQQNITDLNLDIFKHEVDQSSADWEHAFDLSQVYSQVGDYPDDSDEQPQNRRAKFIIDQDENQSVIASDSSFNDELNGLPIGSDSENDEVKPASTARKPIKKSDKKKANTQESEKTLLKETVDITAISDVGSKSQKRKKNKKKKAGQQASVAVAVHQDPNDRYNLFKQLIVQGDTEFLMQQMSQNPYEQINKKTHKIEITAGFPYKSSSVDEVFEIRNALDDALSIQRLNRFIKPKMPQFVKVDAEIEEKIEAYIKPIFEAYQLKTVYQIYLEDEVEFDDDDDDALILALQPYDTVMSVGYGHLLTHKPIKFVARRSDIIVSSTLSITLSPADSIIRPQDKGLLTPDQISEWCNKRHEYRGSLVTIAKRYELEEDNTKRGQSTIFQSEILGGEGTSFKRSNHQVSESEVKFVNQTLRRPRLIPPTLLTRPLAPEKINLLNEEEKRLYTIQKGKYDTQMRIIAKRELQNDLPVNRKFNLSQVDQLLQGKHHEEEDDVLEDFQAGASMYLGREDNFKQQQLSDFENQARQLLKEARPKKVLYTGDYIPQEIKSELDLPNDLEQNNVNFNEVIKKDCSRKRKTPLWSGQDVLQVGLTNALSGWVVYRINALRVWPQGFFGYIKKARCALKMVVKHDLFGNLMTLFVLLNTIVMGMEHYDMSESEIAFSTTASEVFTWIFICEMTSKLLAIGPKKYLLDKMNWLDGGVVSLSIFEMLLIAAGGGGGNLSAFRTLRVLRTFRILRVARLLRSLKSMQVIIAVIGRSASSFLYITLLLFVFIFIFTLLGMQVFGGKFGSGGEVPRGNYDSFIIAFLTVFQVLTTENWNSVLYDSMRSESVGYFIPALYYVSWIFVGNYILLNLFLAILLDGFLSEDDEEEGDQDEIERIAKAARKIKIEKEKIRRMKKMGNFTNQKSNIQQEWEEENKKPKNDEVDDLDDLDAANIREIFMEEGLIKKKDPAREERLMFNGVKCEMSMYLISKKNKFRYYAYKLYKHKLFDNIIMLLIGLSSCKLAADSYIAGYSQDSIQVKISDSVDIFLNVCFQFEMCTKIVALGFVMDDGSYLRESWNVLDCFIVATSTLDMCLTNVDIPVIKILRLLRTLRPLRVISHNVAMKLIVNSLFMSVGAIFNVIIVILCVWLMFAIFAINMFAGKMQFCDIGKYVYHTKYECNVAGGSWINFVSNFDDVMQAMLTLFNVATLEGWPDVMVQTLDMVEVDQGPQFEASKINGFFFVIYILIGSFFLMNFFVGVLFMKYAQAQAKETIGQTNEMINWIAIQKMICEQRCDHAIMNKPNNNVHPKRFYYWKIANAPWFENGILFVIVLNIVQMGIAYENAPVLYTYMLDLTNYFFTAVFTIEMYVKMRAYSYRYFETSWNKFDCFIVSASLLDIALSFSPTQNSSFSIGPQIARIMRVLRVTRIIKLAKNNEGLQALMATITLSVGPLINVFGLLALALFIFAVLGIFFFGTITTGNYQISEWRNFQNFGNSYLFLFIIQTGENWNLVMYDCLNTPPNCQNGVDCGTSLAPIFYIIFVIFIQNVMLNLFILVIITQFETYYMSDDSPIAKYQRNLDIFMKTWIKFTVAKYRCTKLREKQMPDFFKALPMPFGLPPETTDDQMKKIMLKMGIRSDDGYIYFNELLYRCMRRMYGSFKLNRKMQIIELKTQYKIYNITLQVRSFGMQKEVYEQFFKNMIGIGKSVNPFLLMMYYHISFNTWYNYSKLCAKRERHYLKEEKIRTKCVNENKAYVPTEFQEEQEKLIEVSIEVDELVYYTSEDDLKAEEQAFSDNQLDPKSSIQRKKTLTNKSGNTLFKKTQSVGQIAPAPLQEKVDKYAFIPKIVVDHEE